MNIFTVSLFGHRECEDLRYIESQLRPIIEQLLEDKSYVNFLIGRNGEFDEYAASVIKRARKEIQADNSELTLVIPYTLADIEFYEKYYDDIIIPESLHGVHPKSAISAKNRWMVEQSDLIIVYVERESGGAFTAMKYAKKLGKRVVNLFE